MDDQGNPFFDFEFNMDADDLQMQMEQFLRDFNMNSPFTDELYLGESPRGNYMISIDDVSDSAKTELDIPSAVISFDQLSIVPKPAMSSVELQFTLTKQEPFRVLLQDENNQVLIYDERSEKNINYSRTIDLGDYPEGNYYLTISQGSQGYSKKLVKHAQ